MNILDLKKIVDEYVKRGYGNHGIAIETYTSDGKYCTGAVEVKSVGTDGECSMYLKTVHMLMPIDDNVDPFTGCFISKEIG